MSSSLQRIPKIISRGLNCFLVVLSMGFMTPVFADEVNPFCDGETFNEIFSKYVPDENKKMIMEIQRQLVASDYGSIDIDGEYGQKTKAALIKYCKDLEIKEPEDLARGLIKFWESRALPVPEPYYQWASEKKQDPSAIELLPDGPPIPDAILEKLLEIEGVIYPNAWSFQLALKALGIAEILIEAEPVPVPKSGENPKESEVIKSQRYAEVEASIFKQAAIQPMMAADVSQLSGGGCGCSRDFSAEVYGFYPYWLVSQNDDSELKQTIDFSIFDRIGFYALTLDQEGNIGDSENWDDNVNFAGFINKAHKHRVDVDLTLFASGWQGWGEAAVHNAKNNITLLINQKFKARHTSIARAILPLVENNTFVSMDGITLVFENHVKATSSGNLVDVLDQVIPEKTDQDKSKINLVIDLSWNSSDTALFRQLEEKLFISDNNKSRLARIFTLLPEPTTKSKKILRRLIEDSFRGEKRRNVLRKIIPIVSIRGIEQKINSHEIDPFVDDLIYFDDNFAGIGLWPLPVGPPGNEIAKNVSDKIIEQFQRGGLEGNFGESVGGGWEWVCDIVCPNRFWFRVGLDLLAAMLILYFLIALLSCKIELFSGRYFFIFPAIFVFTLLFVLLLKLCDPFWQERANIIFGSLFVVVIGGFGIHQLRKALRPKAP